MDNSDENVDRFAGTSGDPIQHEHGAAGEAEDVARGESAHEASGGSAAGLPARGETGAGADRAQPPKSGSAHSTGSELSALDFGPADLSSFMRSSDSRASAGAPRGRFAAHIDLASNLAFVVCVLGFAFAAGTYFFGGAPGASVKTAAVQQSDVDRAAMVQTSQKMAADLSALKANVDALRVSLGQQTAANGQRGFEKSLDALKTKLDSVRSATEGQLAELSNKVDRLQHDPALQQVAERLDRIEKQTASMLPTGSVAPMIKAATEERSLAAQTKPSVQVDAPKRPTLITSWVVRDVYNGVALVENARGAIEVALGDTVPGAGMVKSIERRGGGWIVITNRGLIDYDHTVMVP